MKNQNDQRASNHFLNGILICCFFVIALLANSLCQAEDAVTISVEELPNPASTTIDALAARATLQRFQDQFPHYKIERFAMPAIGGSAMDSGPLMAIAAGTPPNVMRVNFRQSSTYIEQGFLEPLEIMMARIVSKDNRVRQYDEKGQWLAEPTAKEIEQALEQLRIHIPKPSWP